MKRSLFVIAMILGASAAVLAQADREPLNIRKTPVTQADLKNLANWLMQAELQERNELMAELHRLNDVAKTPQKLQDENASLQKFKDLMKVFPPEIDREALQKELPNIPLDKLMPKPQHVAANPFREPDRSAVQTNPPQVSKMAENNPTVHNLLRLWEKNVGPLDKTPTLKKIFVDLLKNGVSGDEGPSGPFNDDTLNSLFNSETPAGREIAEMLETAANGSSWKWADLGLNDWKLNLPETQSYSAPGQTWSPSSAPDSGDSPSLLKPMLALAALAIAVIALRRAGWLGNRSPDKIATASVPPIDPNSIADRESLVKAFEAMSLAAIGQEAAAWNHRTIALELNRRVVVASGTAAEAARLYELARYAPPAETFSAETFAQARRCLVLLGEAAAQ